MAEFTTSALGDITKLSILLDDSRKRESDQQKTFQAPVQSNITNVVHSNQKFNSNEINQKLSSESAIWQIDEIPTEDSLIDLHDQRPTPRYEFSYKQIIGTEDTFWGLNDKSPASSDCSHLIVKVYFPGSTMKDLELDVTSNRVRASSKSFKLFTYLPKKVDERNGKAAFDLSKEVLTLTLPIVDDD